MRVNPWIVKVPSTTAVRDTNPLTLAATYIGRKAHRPKARGHHHKHTVVTLVERGGEARAFRVTGLPFI